MPYIRIKWEDYPSESTPLSAENLNKMDAAIEELYKSTGSTIVVNNMEGPTIVLDATNIKMQGATGTSVAERLQIVDENISTLEEKINDIGSSVVEEVTEKLPEILENNSAIIAEKI